MASEIDKSHGIDRRRFISCSCVAALGLFGSRYAFGVPHSELPPVRTITKGPKFHWFSYYDKLEFDPTGRYVLGMEVDFEHRSPKADDCIKVGMVDLQDGDRWIELGQSTAWCWQQGCMLQWVPGSKSRIVWNDREKGRYVCRIMDVFTREQHTIPYPIYALSPDGRTAVSTDFARVADERPGYGYNGIADPYANVMAPSNSGITQVNLETGDYHQVLSLAEISEFGIQLPTMKGAKHSAYHLLFNPDGTRFVFLHRWNVGRGRQSRMLTADPDGGNVRVIDANANGLTSHFQWRDKDHILAWSEQPSNGKALYLFEDGGGCVEVIAPEIITLDGHCSYLPGGEWILNDTYPDEERMQKPYLYHVKTGKVVRLGKFHSPALYTGEWRCDTHPRYSQDGRHIVIDSPHTGGRQMHLIDIGNIVSSSP